MHIENLYLELTRKCNLKCGHCLRGCAQNKSMSRETLYELFAHVDSVGSLTIGGGEPSLAVQQLNDLYNILCWKRISIESLFLVTNGKHIHLPFLEIVVKLNELCYDRDVSAMAISNDEYHFNERGFKRFPSEYEDYVYDRVSEEDWFPIQNLNIREHSTENTYRNGGILRRGRAKDWGDRDTPYLDCMKFTDLDDCENVEGEMYVCYNGDVVGDANMSYADMKQYVRGNVHDWDNLVAGIVKSTEDNYHWCKAHCDSVSNCYYTSGPQIEQKNEQRKASA